MTHDSWLSGPMGPDCGIGIGTFDYDLNNEPNRAAAERIMRDAHARIAVPFIGASFVETLVRTCDMRLREWT